ncbi:MAG: AraC family transcriptional regulator, partial [Prevotella sp.]|nr:AraC family transcriptional regulator [Prevotella sp.]
YLSRVTTDVVGYPPKQLIFNYIMQEACSLLKTSRLSLGEISAHLGFSNESRFVAFFKNQHGVSPGVWRKR